MQQRSPSAAKNQEPILGVLRGVLPASGTVLEIASGSGEHALRYAREFPALTWQPSDADPPALASIDAWREGSGLANLLPARLLDALAPAWPVAAADAVVCINMVHISPWTATLGLLAGAARVLQASGAPLVLYGPYIVEGRPTAPSNLAFDADLRARNPAWGVRSLGAVVAAAHAVGLVLERTVDMPGNNLTIILRKR